MNFTALAPPPDTQTDTQNMAVRRLSGGWKSERPMGLGRIAAGKWHRPRRGGGRRLPRARQDWSQLAWDGNNRRGNLGSG